ncbi:MAG: trypsin-like peptidase domain-containing protein [Nitrospinae bacterium]|nr:trypsin-like peptidase domain-containing protein [Nitrospinota bacterium]
MVRLSKVKDWLFRGARAVILVLCFLITAGVPAHADDEPNILKVLEDALVSLADRVRPAVVSLSPYVPPSPSVRRQGENSGRSANAGAGVIIDGVKGLMVTNHHVVRGSGRVTVTLFDGVELVGTVLGTDEDTDLAVVKIETDRILVSAEFADSSQLKIGQLAVAVGNPYGLNDTMTFGIISGLNRENINLSRYEDFIQTDASINPGNSGGPLLNIQGKVIGINTAIINYAQSIGFAIPSNIVRKVVAELIEFGEVRRGWLGVGIERVTREIALQAKSKEGKGVWINSVFEGDPAHQAGLRIGDIILKIGGASVDTPSRMIRLIGSFSPGQSVNLDILREGRRKVITVKLESHKKGREKQIVRAEGRSRAPLGLEVEGSLDQEGVVVSRLIPGSPAEQAGLRVGDRIEAVNGRPVAGAKEFKIILNGVSTGESVFLLVLRNEEKFHLALVRED